MKTKWKLTTILVMAIILSTGAGLAGGYALWGDQGNVSPPSRIEVVALDSFTLADLDDSAESVECQTFYEEIAEGFPEPLPCSKCGLYYNKFFLKQGESIEIIVRSNVPMGRELMNPEGGLEVLYGTSYSVPYEGETGYFEQLRSVGDGECWEVRDAFAAEADGFFFIYIENESGKQAWCQYVVIKER